MFGLEEFGYGDFQETPHGYVCLAPFIFTYAIMVGVDETGYLYRYCYHTLSEARGALMDWKDNDYEGEPEGFIKRKG